MQSFLFYQQYLCVTQKLQLPVAQPQIPAAFVLQLSQLSFSLPWRKAERRLQTVSAFKTTHTSAAGEGIFLFPLLPSGLTNGIQG